MPIQTVLVSWSDRSSREVVIEDRLDEDGWSAYEPVSDTFVFINDDGTVEDDRGDGDLYGEVIDWRGVNG